MASQAEQRRILEERKKRLLEEYATANDQIAGELSNVNRRRLQKQAEGIAEELDEVEAQIEKFGPASHSPITPSSNDHQPQYENERNQQLATALTSAETRLEEALIKGDDTADIRSEILDLKRELRAGGRLKPGDTLMQGRYRLLKSLGQGGFAVVWKAFDRRRHQLVAIKVLHGQYGHDRTRRKRFFRGAHQMAALQHQGIVQVFEEELEDDEYHFFIMEYLEGGDFQGAVLDGHLPLKNRIEIILAVGEALSYAHERKVIHRDIKPANILLDAVGKPRLTDFDLVRAEDTTGMTRTGMMGTIVFAAPELMNKPQEAKEPADVYGLAMSAVFATRGTTLYTDVLREAPAIIDCCAAPEEVKEVLKKGIAWRVEERYPTVETFCQALRKAIESDIKVETKWNESTKLEATPYEGNQPVSFRDPFKDKSTQGPEMVWLPGGTFLMGDGRIQGGMEEYPVAPVRVDAFGISRFPVTVAEYLRFCESTGNFWPEWLEKGSRYHIESGIDDWYSKRGMNRKALSLPVVGINWTDAVRYCDWLSEKTGKSYELPSEAQWEYACRAGSETAYCFGNHVHNLGDYAWYENNANGRVHPVGMKKANDFGLHDMHGNVWEWVNDQHSVHDYGQLEMAAHHRASGFWNDDEKATKITLMGIESGFDRIICGGSWRSSADDCRSACRDKDGASSRGYDLGFRLSRKV